MQNTISMAGDRELQGSKHVYEQLLLREHDNAEIFHSFGLISYRQGKYREALGFLNRSVETDPNVSKFYNTIGVVYEGLGEIDKAINAYEQAISLEPDNAEAHHNMSIALQSKGDFQTAARIVSKAICIRPDWAEAHNTFGYISRILRNYDIAEENFRKAIELKPDYAEAHNQLGVVLNSTGRFKEALECYDRAISCDADYAEAHWNRALVLLLTGRFIEGWKEYEWRKDPSLRMLLYPHELEGPKWDGSNFVGKTLFVHYEQGMGDTLHFVRYLPMVKERGGRLILEIRSPLRDLLHDFSCVDEIIDASSQHKPNVDYDYHVSLMDLPGIFETTEASIPSNVPYIHSDKSKVEFWRSRICKDTFKIGIVWSGSPTYMRNETRSCMLEDFAGIAAIDGVSLYSLQKGDPVSQIEANQRIIPIEDLGSHFTDFTDTAAAIENMDLIISVDTSVLHLAGAMGKPVWGLICAWPAWRWHLERTDNPWYPTMKLFRQKHRRQWDDVFACVEDELRKLLLSRKEAGEIQVATQENTCETKPACQSDSADLQHILGLKAYSKDQYDQALQLIKKCDISRTKHSCVP